MAAFVVHPTGNEERVALLSRLASQLGFEVYSVPTLDAVRAHAAYQQSRALVMMPELQGGEPLAESAIGFAAGQVQRAYVVYIGDTMTADEYKRLVRTGAGEWIKWEALAREIVDVVRVLKGTAANTPVVSATIVSLLPSKGGVGNTTLALEVAIALRASRKGPNELVAVLDLNFQGGTLADYLDLEARFNIAEIAHRPERLDAQLVEIFASKHESKIDIFSSPPRHLKDEEVNPDVIFALLDEVGKHYDIVLLDLPNHWQPWCDNVIQGSSAVVLTGESTVPSVRQLAIKQKHLDDLEISQERTAIVVNRCETNFVGRYTRKGDIERAFPNRRLFFVARDDALALEAVNTGRPMSQVSPRRKVVKDIAKVGRWIQSTRNLPIAN